MRICSLIVIALSLCLSSCNNENPPTVEFTPSVKTLEIGEQAQGQIRRLSGKVIAAESTSLSFAVSGTVSQVGVSAGETVTEGQILASLESRPFELVVESARAELSIARAQTNEKQQRFKRMQDLLARDVVSAAEFEVAETELSVARGNLRAAQSKLSTAERDLDKIALIAPFAGQIAERNIEPFQEISKGSEAFVLQTEGALEVEVSVPETIIRDVDYGHAVQVAFPTIENLAVNGAVSEIGSQVKAGNAFPVKIQISGENTDLRPGMSASVIFNFDAYLAEQTVYLIPLAALAIDDSVIANYQNEAGKRDNQVPVYIFDGDTSTVNLRTIRVGDIRGNELEVYEGLQAGDLVVTAGVAFLRDGMNVQMWDANSGLLE